VPGSHRCRDRVHEDGRSMFPSMPSCWRPRRRARECRRAAPRVGNDRRRVERRGESFHDVPSVLPMLVKTGVERGDLSAVDREAGLPPVRSGAVAGRASLGHAELDRPRASRGRGTLAAAIARTTSHPAAAGRKSPLHAASFMTSRRYRRRRTKPWRRTHCSTHVETHGSRRRFIGIGAEASDRETAAGRYSAGRDARRRSG
jgi:hypothetical protein